MPHDAFWLPASEHCSLYVHQWLPATPVKAVVLLAHGMAEHAGRYQRLGHALSNVGYALLAADLRGHGRTAQLGSLGLFARIMAGMLWSTTWACSPSTSASSSPARRCSCSATAWAATSPRPI